MAADEWDSFKSEAAEGWDKIKNDFSDGWDKVDNDFEEVKLDAGCTTANANETPKGVDEDALKIGDTTPYSRPVRHMDANSEGFWRRDGGVNYEANGTKKYQKVDIPEEKKVETDDAGEDLPENRERAERSARKSGKNSSTTIIVLVIALVLVVGIVLFITTLIKGCGGGSTPTQEDTSEQPATTASWDLNGNAEVTDLINRYYAARTLVDTYSLSEILDPSVTIDEAALANEANVVDEYKDISVYTTPGMKEGEWAAYVGYSIKFKNIATAAPGLEATYVRTDENGQLRLLPYDALSNDTALNAYVAELANCDAIAQLVTNADTEYKKALSSDEALYTFIKQIGGNVDVETTAAEGESTEAVTDSTEAPAETTATETTAETAATTAAVSADDSLTECDDIMYVNKNDVNMRDKASTEGEVIASLAIGTKVQVVAKGENWAKIVRLEDGKTGYCSRQFLQGDPVSTTTTD